MALVALLAGVDLGRRPDHQVLAAGYEAAVGAYQWTKPRLGIPPCCRFSPTCSHYSAEAVRRYGLWKGLRLTADRLNRCRTSVPLGTFDPVPGEAAASSPAFHEQP